MSDTDQSIRHTNPPERLGPYRILQVLGEGAMGVVYEAEETSPVRRHVALKVVKAGLNSKEIAARFDAERQALAVMDHVGIAKVFAAGATETGEPFVAIELVKGLPITGYCDAHKLSVQQRLELFIGVCHAVQHAHQKGIIHRDLKPSNILVGEHDGRAAPKVIDFGIAKALGAALTDITFVTQWGQAIGTPAYMSPEQAESSGLDVDTRADIYSLGVLLYELLVGQLPLDPRAMSLPAFLARLATGDASPPTPSARVSTLGGDGQFVAHARGTSIAHLRVELKGDLDWIVMKALEPDRARRYATANELAADIQRHLADEPVMAHSPSTAYRLSKFVRRHRAGATAAIIASVAITAGAVAATIGLVRARHAERSATEEAKTAEAVTTFLVDLFKVSNPSEARGNAITAREILDRGTEHIRGELKDQPLLRARLMQTLGTVDESLGLYEPARALLSDALQIREHELGPNDQVVAENLTALSAVSTLQGNYTEAERQLRAALAIREQRGLRNDTATATTLMGLAGISARQNKNAEAESSYVRAIAIDEAALGSSSRRLPRMLRSLAVVHMREKHYATADSLIHRALDIQERTLGRGHVDVAATLLNLGALYWTEDRFADALAPYERARAIDEKALGPDHPDLASVLNNLAETYWKLNRYAEAETLFRRALAIKEKALPAGNPSIAVTLNGLASLLRDEKRYAEAESLFRQALEIRERAFGPSNPNVVETLKAYAVLLKNTGRAREAAALEARAVAAAGPAK